MPKKIVFVLFLIVQTIFAQTSVESLVDSLTVVKTKKAKIELSHKIAFQLKDNDWQRALHYVNYANKLAKETGSKKTIANSYHQTAQFYYAKDALDAALNFYLKTFDYYKTQPNSSKKMAVENGLAIVYSRLRENEKALYYFRNVRLSAEKIHDSLAMAKALNNLGTSFLETKTDSSLYFYRMGLKISKQLNSAKLEAYLYSNLGRNYAIQKKTDSANYYFKAALDIVKNRNLPTRTKSWVYKATANYYFDQKEVDSTITYAKKVVSTLNERFSFDNQDAVQILYKSYLLKNDYQMAAHYFEIYDEVRDSLKIEEKLANVERLTLEQDYKTRKKTRQLKESRRRFNYFVIGLSLVILLLISALLIIRYKSKLSKTRLQNDLMQSKEKELDATIELKNKELTSKAMQEIHRNEIIQSVLEELKHVKRKAVKKETKAAIDDVSKQLKNSDQEKIWKEFQMSFEKVYTSFFENLHEKHPDLTLREKRLCTLLKLNLTTKEIAQISGQSFKSVENSRTRLRKKLNLTNTKTDLSDYLFKFS